MNALFDEKAHEESEWLTGRNDTRPHPLWPFSRMKFDLLRDAGYDFHGGGQHSNILGCAKRFRRNECYDSPSTGKLDELIDFVITPLYTEPLCTKRHKSKAEQPQTPDSPPRPQKNVSLRKKIMTRVSSAVKEELHSQLQPTTTSFKQTFNISRRREMVFIHRPSLQQPLHTCGIIGNKHPAGRLSQVQRRVGYIFLGCRAHFSNLLCISCLHLNGRDSSDSRNHPFNTCRQSQGSAS